MLLLSLLGQDAVDEWLARHELKAFTSHTITDPKRMKAELNRIRAQDWALSEQQLDLAYRGVAVPLRDHKGNVQAALTVSMPIQFETSKEAINRVLPVLRDVAQNLRPLI
jgi:IclR family pca regulon transcriptional regulator